MQNFILYMHSMLSQKDRQAIAACSDEELQGYRFTLCRWIRENFIYDYIAHLPQPTDLSQLYDADIESLKVLRTYRDQLREAYFRGDF